MNGFMHKRVLNKNDNTSVLVAHNATRLTRSALFGHLTPKSATKKKQASRKKPKSTFCQILKRNSAMQNY